MVKISIHDNRRGFSIIELMVVLAVLGVLVTTLSPGYQKYILQAKSMEGPIALSQVYSAEQEVYADTGTFVACVFALGLEPEYSGYFVTGFGPAANVGKDPALVANCDTSVTQIKRTCPVTYSTEAECTDEAPAVNTSDYMIIPTILKVRGGGTSTTTFNPYLDTDEGVCSSSTLSTQISVNPGGGFPYGVLGGGQMDPSNGNKPIGLRRKDDIFTACSLAALASKTDTNTTPTAYTINEKKELKHVSRGW